MDYCGFDDSDNVTKWGNLPATKMRNESNFGVGDEVVVGASGKKESAKSPHPLCNLTAKKPAFQIFERPKTPRV